MLFTWTTRSDGEVEMEMANNDLRKNASGYSDPTAYKAITSADADDGEMQRVIPTRLHTRLSRIWMQMMRDFTSC